MKFQWIFSISLFSHLALSDVFNPDPSLFPDWSEYTKFDPAQYIQLKRMSSPAISPNRKQMVYQQYQYNKTSNSGRANLRWVDISKGFSSAIDLTPNVKGQGDTSPIWINDNTVAFLATRGTPNTNIFTVSTVDGSVSQVTNFTNGVSGIVYGSQAKRIAFISKVYQGMGIEESAAERARIDGLPSSGVVHKKLFVRHWNEWILQDRYQLFTIPVSDQGSVKPTGDPVNIVEKYTGEWGLEPDSYNFSPDGKSILFSAKIQGKEEAWQTEAGVFQAPVDGSSAPVRLNSNFKGAASSPVYSPDGTSIAWLQMGTPGYESDQNQVILYKIASQSQTRLIPYWEKSPLLIKFSDDSKKIIFTAPFEKDRPLFIIDIASNTATRFTSNGTVRSMFQIDSNSFIISLSTLQFPDSLFILDTSQDSGKLTQLTFENKAVLDTLWLSPTQTFWFNGAMNESVQAMLLYPFGFDPTKKYPVIYLIHGGPQQSWNDGWSTAWSPNMYANQGFVVVIVNFHGGDAYGQKFTDSIRHNWGTYPYEDLMTGLDVLISNAHYVDPSNIVGIGASYGGYMVNWLNGHTDRFKAFVNHDGVFNTVGMYYMTEELWFMEHDMGIPWIVADREIYEANNPERFTANWKTPTLFIHSEFDFRIPVSEGISAFTVLQRKGIDSKLLYFPDEDHFVSKPPNQLKWLSEILGFSGSHTNTTVWQLD
ncbi:Dipeptidyl-peptidase 5 [Smittium mucronatum]|uniref:Dipeptidyl-peptidase V n=1 Tax=Smittium mucronatum TaxID=133383 RepID=A0A1R0GUY9_9FUNG|nr:Dipeptidyl-peptidase 5 [Smittium mucronatum]